MVWLPEVSAAPVSSILSRALALDHRCQPPRHRLTLQLCATGSIRPSKAVGRSCPGVCSQIVKRRRMKPDQRVFLGATVGCPPYILRSKPCAQY